MNILFVCSGNISRSYLAEMLLKEEVRKRKLGDISISSVGLFAYPGSDPDPNMVDYLFKRRIPTGFHTARLFTREDLDWADHILVMERSHMDTINTNWPGSEAKVVLLGSYISGELVADDIIDPYGKSIYYYRSTQSQIALAVSVMVKKLISGPT